VEGTCLHLSLRCSGTCLQARSVTRAVFIVTGTIRREIDDWRAMLCRGSVGLVFVAQYRVKGEGKVCRRTGH
jgi:hypothetical protein